jgi:hypothetical protein
LLQASREARHDDDDRDLHHSLAGDDENVAAHPSGHLGVIHLRLLHLKVDKEIRR